MHAKIKYKKSIVKKTVLSMKSEKDTTTDATNVDANVIFVVKRLSGSAQTADVRKTLKTIWRPILNSTNSSVGRAMDLGSQGKSGGHWEVRGGSQGDTDLTLL